MSTEASRGGPVPDALIHARETQLKELLVRVMQAPLHPLEMQIQGVARDLAAVERELKGVRETVDGLAFAAEETARRNERFLKRTGDAVEALPSQLNGKLDEFESRLTTPGGVLKDLAVDIDRSLLANGAKASASQAEVLSRFDGLAEEMEQMTERVARLHESIQTRFAEADRSTSAVAARLRLLMIALWGVVSLGVGSAIIYWLVTG